LNERIIELSVGITKLMIFNEQLETLSQPRFGSMILGKGRHGLRVFNDKCGIQTLAFQEMTN
jgi:hypothetical protein